MSIPVFLTIFSFYSQRFEGICIKKIYPALLFYQLILSTPFYHLKNNQVFRSYSKIVLYHYEFLECPTEADSATALFWRRLLCQNTCFFTFHGLKCITANYSALLPSATPHKNRKHLAMRNTSGKNMGLWKKKGDWYPPQADYLYPFSRTSQRYLRWLNAY